MSSAEKSEWVSVEDYLANEAIASFKSEYIDGWVRAMTGATNRHNQVKLNAVFHLMRSLRGQPCKVWDSDTKVRIQKSDRRYDLDEKMMAYLQIASPEHLVLLEQHQPIAIVMRRDGNAFVREIIEGIEFTPTCVQETDPEYHVA